MPIVTFGGVQIECELGANLRRVLLNAKLPLYNPVARVTNCRGLGACGTCAVKLRGSASWPTKIEAARLRLPPHTAEAGLRLACKVLVHGDLDVEKFAGVWGQDLNRPVRLGEPRSCPPPCLPVAPKVFEPAVPSIQFRSSRSVIRSLHVASGRRPASPRRHRAAMSEPARVTRAKLVQLVREREPVGTF